MQTITGVGKYTGLVEESLSNNFLPKTLRLESISGGLRKILDLGDKTVGLRILNPIETVDEIYRTSLACRKCLVESLITGEALSTSEHRACVQQSSRDRK